MLLACLAGYFTILSPLRQYEDELKAGVHGAFINDPRGIFRNESKGRANVKIIIKSNNLSGYKIPTIVATRKIKKGQQLFMSYNREVHITEYVPFSIADAQREVLKDAYAKSVLCIVKKIVNG